MPGHSELELAKDAADVAFVDVIRHLIEQLHLGLADSRGDVAASVARFEAGLARAKQARELALASIAKMIV
jgi:hypothetical protein